MEIPYIKNKKAARVIDTFSVIIVGIFAFGVIFTFILANANDSNVFVEQRYNQTYQKLLAQQNNLTEITLDMRNLFDTVNEPTSGLFGYFGLNGVLAIVKAPVVVVEIGFTTLALMFGLTDNIPQQIVTTVSISTTIIILFGLIAFLTNRGREP